MQIIDVEQVEGNFYGGYPYRVSWSFNGESEPSRLVVEVVNETGEYSTPELSFDSIESITLGEFVFEGYLVTYSINSTAEQKTLTLEYADKSILLDKYWVGLYGIHSEGPNILLLGKQYHPCDINLDSSVDYTEEESRQIDPCDPCPFSPVDKYKEACDPRTNLVENFETYYTFSELVPEVASVTGLTIDFDASNFYMYKAQHIGNLRSVLSSWCSDLGLSFYWDPITSSLIFKLRTSFGSDSPISISDVVDNPKATEISYKKTILNTFTQGFIGRYEKPGGIQKYECSKNTWKMLRPIVVGDLFLPDATPAGSKYSGELSPRSIAIALSYYSSTLRDAFLWFSHYGILNAKDAEGYLEANRSSSSSSGNSSSSSKLEEEEPETDVGTRRTTVSAESNSNDVVGVAKGNSFVPSIESVDEEVFQYTTTANCGEINNLSSTGGVSGDSQVLTHFGNMVIKKVMSVNSSDPEDARLFRLLRDNMPTELQKIYMSNNGTDEDPKYYFIIADSSEEAYDASVSVDRNLAQNFLGKYWFNKFRTIVTGATDDRSECDVLGPSEDGSGRWFKAKQGADSIEIFKYGHEDGSFVSTLKTSIQEDIEENLKTDDNRLLQNGSLKNPENFVTNSFVLYSRNGPKWSPEIEFSDKWYASYYSWLAQQIPHKYQNSDGRPDLLYSIFPEANWNENIRIFIVRELESFDIEISKSDHPLENRGGYKIRIEEDVYGNQFKVNEGPWGLMSTECYQLNVQGTMPIFVPPGAFAEELSSYEGECVDAPTYSLLSDEFYSPISTSYTGPGYRTYINCKSEFPRVFQKYRYRMTIPAENVEKVQQVNYVDYQLAESNVAIFGNQCVPDEGILTAYMEDLGSTSQYSYSDPLFDVSFKLAGVVPEVWDVNQGLSSMTVEVTENGTFTTYGFGTKIIQAPGVSYMEQNLRSQKRSPFGNQLGLMTSVKTKTIR
jgi:hypothetical protein